MTNPCKPAPAGAEPRRLPALSETVPATAMGASS